MRASYMGLGGLVVAASLAYQPMNMVWWAFLAVSALVWPHIAYLHSKRQRDPFQAEYLNCLMDALIVGCWVVLMQWSLLPSICIMAISMSDRSYLGLKQRWGHFVAALLAGMTIMAALVQPAPQWLAPLGVQISLLPLVILHTAYTSRSTRRMLKALARQNLQLKLLGRIDPLTTVYSRDYWWKKARTALRQYHNAKEQTCLLVIDIDHFKRINDAYGHIVGDEVLKLIGLTIRQCLRSHDIAGRYGGDEFTVLCKHAKAEDAYFVALRIRDKLAQIRVREHPDLRVSASIGVAAADDGFESVTAWIKAADSALYSAKDAGRDQIIDASSGPGSRFRHSPATTPMSEEQTLLEVVAEAETEASKEAA
ncbi:MAG: diguanylate cyclase [Comamonas sp.]